MLKKSCKNCEYGLVEDIAQGRGGWLCAWGGMAYTACLRYKSRKPAMILYEGINNFFRRFCL